MTALALAAAYALAVVAVARATRLVIFDPYPPAAAARRWWWNQTIGRGGWRAAWHKLAVGEEPHDPGCPFCASPYITAVTLAVAIAGDVWTPDLGTVGGWWWVAAVWASVSYLSAMLVLRDEPPEG